MNELMAAARAAAHHAYSPYSRIRVGAACLTPGGDVVTGANVENASYGLSICAERVAVASAIAGGHRRIIGLAVWSDHGLPWPCGACLQFVAEVAAPDSSVWLGTGDQIETMVLSDLMPRPFRLDPGGNCE